MNQARSRQNRRQRCRGCSLWKLSKFYLSCLVLLAGYQLHRYIQTIEKKSQQFSAIGKDKFLLASSYQRMNINHKEEKQLDQEEVSFSLPERKINFDAEKSGVKQEQQQLPTFAIFYNAYINPNSINQSLQIVEEQLNKISASSHNSTSFFYNVLGYNLTENMLCSQLSSNGNQKPKQCKQINYYPSGDESITLQDVYEYCQVNPLSAVVYLHDKGSFHPTGSNRRIRKVATASALSDACHYFPPEKCNLCVNKFQFLPNHHTPGAMWVGNCTYLKTLIPPKDFASRRHDMFKTVRYEANNMQQSNISIVKELYCIQKLVENFEENQAFNGDQWKFLSLGRYAMEHWAFSGPNLQPCHTIDFPLIKVKTDTFAPTNATIGPGKGQLIFESATTTGWYQLKGRLWEMNFLYNTTPPSSSFIWSVYKDAYVHNASKIRC